ncbi:MAG: YceI family protein [Flavobacteriales bacterium]|nr:YceI family protein [Flavobacteriales bacterium]
MKKIILTITSASLIALTSCGGGEHDTTSETTTHETAEQTCLYSYADGSATVNWTAFKTNDRTAVGGMFDIVNVTAGEKSSKVTDVLETIKFNIPTSSTNTSNPDRDTKIKEQFFGQMEATDLIIGQVKSATGDNEKGTCTFYLTLNNREQEVVMNYEMNDARIKLTGEIDVTNWGAEGAVESLNKACEALHTGSDGVSKTWPNVGLVIEASFHKDCH